MEELYEIDEALLEKAMDPKLKSKIEKLEAEYVNKKSKAAYQQLLKLSSLGIYNMKSLRAAMKKVSESEQIELDEKRKKRRKRKKKKKKSGGKKDACYHKVKARYDVWPSAYASGALVKCRKVGAANWGNKSKKKEKERSRTDKEDRRSKAHIRQDRPPKERKEKEEMKLTESYVRQVIREEYQAVLDEKKKKKSAKDKMKCNSPRRIRKGEAGHGKKKFVVKACDGGTEKIIRYGDAGLKIKRKQKGRRKNFRARHNCDNPGSKLKARYWSCKNW
jgi:hypothetical protein